MYTVGIDIGGMSIKFGLVDREGNIVAYSKVKTASTPEQGVKDMVEHVNKLLKERSITIADIKGIGIGCPGAVDSKSGVVVHLPNLGWSEFPLVSSLKESLDTEIKISNDANVAALGEAIYGVAKDYNSSIMITLGTGVGGGIIIDKKLFEGGWSRGAELGHVTLIMGGKSCTCGRKGCVECYCSATALMELTREKMLENKDSKMWDYIKGDIANVDGKTAFECSKMGDKSANEVVDTYVSYLGECALNIFNVFRPEAFIFGGGVSAQCEYLNEKVAKYCEKYDYGYKSAPKTKILTATLGNDAGIIGAAALLNE